MRLGGTCRGGVPAAVANRIAGADAAVQETASSGDCLLTRMGMKNHLPVTAFREVVRRGGAAAQRNALAATHQKRIASLENLAVATTIAGFVAFHLLRSDTAATARIRSAVTA